MVTSMQSPSQLLAYTTVPSSLHPELPFFLSVTNAPCSPGPSSHRHSSKLLLLPGSCPLFPSILSFPLSRHTPHNVDPLLPRPTVGSHQPRSCPAWPSQARASMHASPWQLGAGRVSGGSANTAQAHCSAAPPHESLSRVDLRLKGKGGGVLGFRELLNLGAEGAGDGSRLDLRTKLEGLGLKTMRHGLAGCGKDVEDPNARPCPPGVGAPACTGPAGGARGPACEIRSPSRKLSRISKQPRLQLGPGEKPGLEHPCPPAAPAS